jgi:hypothetical protein
VALRRERSLWWLPLRDRYGSHMIIAIISMLVIWPCETSIIWDLFAHKRMSRIKSPGHDMKDLLEALGLLMCRTRFLRCWTPDHAPSHYPVLRRIFSSGPGDGGFCILVVQHHDKVRRRRIRPSWLIFVTGIPIHVILRPLTHDHCRRFR